MRILHICNEYPPVRHGGIGSFTRDLCEKLAAAGHQTAVVGYSDCHSAECRETVGGVEIFRLPLPPSDRGSGRLVRLWHTYTARRALLEYVNRICRDFHPDIVETPEWNAAIPAPPCEGELVIRLHGGHGMNSLSGTKRSTRSTVFWEKRLLKSAHGIIAVSGHIKDRSARYYHLRGREIEVIFNGVDTDRFAILPEISPVPGKMLYVGRIVQPKGLDCLFGVLDRVFASFPQASLELAGGCDDAYRIELLSRVKPENRARIRFLGRMPNEELPRLYASAQLCVFPSLLEAFSVAVLESLACGTPVVYSNTPGVRGEQAVTGGADGFLCNPQDADDLCQAVCRGLQHGGAMRRAAREKALTFSWERILRRNLDYYRKILDGASANV